MDLIVSPDGIIRAVYAEAIDLAVLGQLVISRASHVEPNGSGRWLADLTLVAGPVLGPFDLRSKALEAELAWLATNWLPCNAQ
jgi:hypothetical protein